MIQIDFRAWKEVGFLFLVCFLFACSLLFVRAVLHRFTPPYPHVTCSVVHTLSDHMSHITEWEVYEDEDCGEIHL